MLPLPEGTRLRLGLRMGYVSNIFLQGLTMEIIPCPLPGFETRRVHVCTHERFEPQDCIWLEL